MKEVCILMATYNGEQYIERQIQSIISQRFQNWKLLISDDLSTDGTCFIIEKFCNRYPDKIFFLKEERVKRGVKENFSYLLRQAGKYDYYLFCDQDDIWYENKIDVLVNRLEQQQEVSVRPYLIYSDLEVGKEESDTKKMRFTQFSGLTYPNEDIFRRLLSYNFVPGMSLMFNYALYVRIREIPDKAIIHDWWVSLVAAAFGSIVFVPEILGFYRQHESNVIGAYKNLSALQKAADAIKHNKIAAYSKNNRMLKQERDAQSLCFLDCYRDSCSEKQRKTIEGFHKLLQTKRKAYRILYAIRHKYYFIDIKNTIKLYLF